MFRGDLSTVGLAEIFQVISMIGKEGTLTVKDANSRKCIYFDKDGIQLLSTGRRKGTRIGDLLVHAGKLAPDRLEEALGNHELTKRRLGEVLIDLGDVSPQDIEDVVRGQIEEEVYDLFLWDKAHFEFREGAPQDELRDPGAPVMRLGLDVNALLLEALRRVDEWNLMKERMPGAGSVFGLVTEDTARSDDPPSVRKIIELIDGKRTIAMIIESSGLPKFEVSRTLLDLMDADRIGLVKEEERLLKTDRLPSIEKPTLLRNLGLRIRRILLVEDDPMTRRVLEVILKAGNYVVTKASDATDAMNTVRSGEFVDLVLLDVMIPGMTGLQFCRRLKSQPQTRETPVVLCTSRADEKIVTLARQYGAADFIVKPYTGSVVLEKVDKLLGVERTEVEA